MIKYSWILPVKNEAQSLPQLISEIAQVMHSVIPMKIGIYNYEIIAINDASKDTSLTTLTSLTTKFRQLKLISFKFQQGKWAALRAGFAASRGEIIITSDSDLQDDPKELPRLLAKLVPSSSLRGPRASRGGRSNLSHLGYDLVSGARLKRYDPPYKVILSKLGNYLASILTGRTFKDLNSSFKVYKRQVIDALPKEGSLLRFALFFADKLGYKVVEVPIAHRPRLFGQSKFGIVKYLRIIYDLILILLLFSGSGRIRKNK